MFQVSDYTQQDFKVLPRPSLEELSEYYQSELLKIKNFLENHEEIWTTEVLNEYPKTIPSYKDSWLEEIGNWNLQMEWKTDCGEEIHLLPDSDLKNLFLELETLQDIPRWPESELTDYPSWALHKVSGKKQHEISHIVPLLKAMNLQPGDSFVDIGGGKGHLSRILCLYHGLNGITLDTSEDFQNLGRERLAKYPAPNGAGNLLFQLHTFGGEKEEEEAEFFRERKASFGLHTCGPLALHHIHYAKAGKALLNFGCCYQKMDPIESTCLSKFSKEKAKLALTKYSLTLASRGHTSISEKDYRLKKRVKKMRSALHFLLIQKGMEEGFTTVGSSHPRLYNLGFEDYAQEKLQQRGVQVNKEELIAFFNADKLQIDLELIYRANLIRWRFGRVIEKYLLFDRALSLVEKSIPAEVYQFFDEKLSPRNIGLLIRP